MPREKEPPINAFIAWLDQELDERKLNDNQLARRAGISHSVLSRARMGLLPRWGACEALAEALDLPAETVFRKAGLLSPQMDDEVSLDEWRYVLRRLSERDRYELLRIARLKLELQDAPQAGFALRALPSFART